MSKHRSNPVILNELINISTKQFNQYHLLKKDIQKVVSIEWKLNQLEVNDSYAGSISITINTMYENNYIELNYESNGKDYTYKIYLHQIPSNLNKGMVTYFICPYSHVRCRKLYLYQGYFVSRKAIQDSCYSYQVISKKYRQSDSLGRSIVKFNELVKEAFKSKYRKTIYAGLRTKKLMKIANADAKLNQLANTA